MEKSRLLLFNTYISLFFSLNFFLLSSSFPSHVPLGIHPLDEKYFASEVIKCKDGSNSFTRDRVNDEFCDCVDGTDEPGTSACPADCCDGSDENDGSVYCHNTCVMGGNVAYKSLRISHHSSVGTKPRKNTLDGDDVVQKIQGLKVVTIVQVVLVAVVVLFFCLFRRRAKSRRRHSR